jgi:non-homologous end joining protein Ku
VLAIIEEKQKAREVTIARPAPPAHGVIDLMEALKRSMRRVQIPESKEKQKGRKKA